MISLSELNSHKYPTTPEIDKNLNILLSRLNKVRAAYGKPLTITSGLRSAAQQQALIDAGKSSATHSKHLIGAAADISCVNNDLKQWIMDNLTFMEKLELWFESFDSTPTWVHAQIFPPASGKRFFIP